jgi:hypothetical protein
MANSPVRRYRVDYAEPVQTALDALIRGAGPRALDLVLAFRRADHILRIYPQFGEPAYDLAPGVTVFGAAIGPLFIRYTVDEPNALVAVDIPIQDCPDPNPE